MTPYKKSSSCLQHPSTTLMHSHQIALFHRVNLSTCCKYAFDCKNLKIRNLKTWVLIYLHVDNDQEWYFHISSVIIKCQLWKAIFILSSKNSARRRRVMSLLSNWTSLDFLKTIYTSPNEDVHQQTKWRFLQSQGSKHFFIVQFFIMWFSTIFPDTNDC